ncbi:MAG: hypothetical protein WDA71_14200, partial [Actinomycetota bacterium]
MSRKRSRLHAIAVGVILAAALGFSPLAPGLGLLTPALAGERLSATGEAGTASRASGAASNQTSSRLPEVGPSGLPDGVPPAALRPEPSLPVPRGWPFPEAFPRTSGTGRLEGGAVFWSDFIYDDHGAKGLMVGSPVTFLAVPEGTYEYPDGPARMNGADIFRAGVGLDREASYWRVDWNTLVDPAIPIAVWGLDTDESTATGVADWPAGAGVGSPGLDAAMIVSSKGAWLVDLASGRRTEVTGAGGSLTVDRAARSFVVRVPHTLLRPRGTWRIRLVAGMANATGDGLAAVGTDMGALPGQPAVFNATFRSYRQEPQRVSAASGPDLLSSGAAASAANLGNLGNLWMEDAQALALAGNDVSPFFLDVRWDELAAR